MDTQKQETAAPEPQEPKREMSPEEMRQRYATMQQNEWDNIANAERVKIARRKGYVDKDDKLTQAGVVMLRGEAIVAPVGEIVTPAHLSKLAPLPGDTMRYATKIGDKNVPPRMATGRLGFFSWPTGRGRRKPRPNPSQQTIKNTSIGIFRTMFGVHAGVLAAEAKEKGEQFNGVPTADISKLGAKASTLAVGVVRERLRARRNRKRRTQELSRRINRGLTPGNVNKRRYIG